METPVTKTIFRCLLGVFIAVASAQAIALPTLQVNADGILMGADNVNVDGTLYDVRFRDGTCAVLYAPCNCASSFVFRSEASARLASQALLDTVLVDGPGPLGMFGSNPELTDGCQDRGQGGAGNCEILTPYRWDSFADSAWLIAAVNDGAGGRLNSFGVTRSFDSTLTDPITFALWCSSPLDCQPAVPELNTISYVGIGGVALLLVMRRRPSAGARSPTKRIVLSADREPCRRAGFLFSTLSLRERVARRAG